jgi:DNA-binding response OmpR family regulator
VSFKNATALLIEDSTTQAMKIMEFLTKEGLGVSWAPDGQSGIEQARRDLPDVIVLDIMMPGMDGFTVLRRLKEEPETAAIPVVMLTAQSDVASLRSSLNMGAVDFIPKDAFSLRVLLETLRDLGVADAPPSLDESDGVINGRDGRANEG